MAFLSIFTRMEDAIAQCDGYPIMEMVASTMIGVPVDAQVQ